MGKRVLTLVGSAVLLLASTLPFLGRVEDPFGDSDLRSLLLELRGLDAELVSDVLRLRLGVETSYDGLMRHNELLDGRVDAFAAGCERLGEPGSRLLAAFRPFRITQDERTSVLERFSNDNATLNNSLRLMGATYRRARERLGEDDDFARRLDSIVRRTLQYFAYPDESERAALERDLDEAVGLPEASGVASAVLGHARIVLAQEAVVDEDVRSIGKSSGDAPLDATFELFEREAQASSRRVERLHAILSAACVLAAVATCSFGAWWVLIQNRRLEREIAERARADAEARRLEAELRQSQKLESIGQLAAGIAHEINTPVQFVSDSVHFVRDSLDELRPLLEAYGGLRAAAAEGRADARLAEAVARAEEQADLDYVLENAPRALERSLEGLERVATIVRSMKEFAHPDQDEQAAVDLNKAIESTLTIARNEYKHVADVETDLGDLPPVTCHGGSINQVLLNILVNAAHAIADAIGDGGSKGRIAVRTRVEGNDVVVAISDSGGGIPEEVRDRIFDPFFTTKDVGRGTGQGLAIARSVVVDKHGGSLTFESALGRGTTFFVRLPLRPASAQAALGAAA